MPDNEQTNSANQTPYERVMAAHQAREAALASRQPRKTWDFVIDGRPHTLQLNRKIFRWDAGPRVFIDGLNAGNIRQPGGDSAQTELILPLRSHEIVVRLEWTPEFDDNMRVDLFIDGISMIDGRSIGEARNTALPPVSRYDTEMWKLQKALRENFPGSIGVALLLGLLQGGRGAGPVGGLLVGIFLIGWFGGLLLVNRSLLARPWIGPLRWLLLPAFVIGYWVAGFLFLVVAASLR